MWKEHRWPGLPGPMVSLTRHMSFAAMAVEVTLAFQKAPRDRFLEGFDQGDVVFASGLNA